MAAGALHLAGRALNRSLDFLLFNPLLEPFWLERLRGQVTCLLYHRVDDPRSEAFLTDGGSPVIAPEALESELRFLRRHGATFLTFEDLRAGHFPGPREIGFIVSFDDCFLQNYTRGLEVLAAVGARAVFFQSTAMVGARELLWEHGLLWHTRDEARARAFTSLARGRLGRYSGALARSGRPLVRHLISEVPPGPVEDLLAEAQERLDCDVETAEVAKRIYPRAEHLRRARALGHEIGSHGHRHYNRLSIDDAVFEEELVRSREALTLLLGEAPASFAYPYGTFRPGDAVLCRRYFCSVVTVEKGRIGPSADHGRLPRFSWPGPSRSPFRRRRWLLTGSI